MEAKKHGKCLILWSVIDCDEDENRVIVYFKDPFKAADFALENFYTGVQMILCRPEWMVKTKD